MLTGVFVGYRERPSTVVPWFTVGKSVLANRDPIIGVVKPVFTRKKLERYRVRQICSINLSALQAAAASDAEQVQQLSVRLRKVVAALDRAAVNVATEREKVRSLCFISSARFLLSIIALITPIIAR